MNKTLLLLLAGWLHGSRLVAQDVAVEGRVVDAAQRLMLAGQVVNAATGAPVAYASVGVAGKPIGAVADGQGKFAFAVAPGILAATERVVVSCVGYQEAPLRVGDFAAGPQTVRLTAQGVALNEVKVKRSGQAKPRQFGYDNKGWSYHYVLQKEPKYFDKDEVFPAAVECGIILNINDKKGCFLDELNFCVERNMSTRTKLRVNVYDVVSGVPGKLLSQQDMLFDVPDDVTGWIKFDLRKHNVLVAGLDEAVVTIQWVAGTGVKTEKGGKVGRFVPWLGIVGTWPSVARPYVLRAASQAPWQNPPAFLRGRLSFYVNTTCYKRD